MMEQKIVIEYLKRSYFALDGLWFVMIEDEFSFDKALEIDEKVWQVLPKIQARKVKEMLGLKGSGLPDFLQAIKVKFAAEEYNYQEKPLNEKHVQIIIHECPWYTILQKANREHLEPRIADAICATEFRVWLREFGKDLKFSIKPRCDTCESLCILDFSVD